MCTRGARAPPSGGPKEISGASLEQGRGRLVGDHERLEQRGRLQTLQIPGRLQRGDVPPERVEFSRYPGEVGRRRHDDPRLRGREARVDETRHTPAEPGVVFVEPHRMMKCRERRVARRTLEPYAHHV